MSSRYTLNANDNRYPRDRSYERRSANDARSSEGAYDQHSSYNVKQGPARDPPRGPKAQIGRSGFVPRGRAFGGRGDSRERDFRGDSFNKSRSRGQEWDPRDRYDPRDRRPSPPSRTRSRSPYREPRDVDSKFRRRDSRDGPIHGVDDFPSRGRANFRGRGRGDLDLAKGRSYHADDRPYEPHGSSRDRYWESSRDYIQDQSRRDEDIRNDRERDRDERFRNDPIPYRSDSRNSFGASRSTSTTDLQANALDPSVSSARNALEAPFNNDRRPYNSDNRVRDGEPPEPSYRRSEHEHISSRANSPPQAPAVPAFGSVLPQASVNLDGPKPTGHKEEEPQVHPSRRALLDTGKVSEPSTPAVLNVPTAPKAQQRYGQEEAIRHSSTLTPVKPRAADLPLETGSNWSKRFPQPSTPLASRSTNTEEPSVRKALEEEGKNGNVSAPFNIRPSNNDPTSQTPPMKIPTGPRAGRGGPPSIRQPMMQQASIRAPMGRGGPTLLGRGRGQASTWSWTSPSYRQPAPRGPSIMNKVPTKRDLDAEEDKVRPIQVQQQQAAVEQWRQKHEHSLTSPNMVANEKDDQDKYLISEITKDDGLQDKPELPPRNGTANKDSGKPQAGKEAVADHEIDMGLDDDDLQISQKKYEREIRLLDARKPSNPRDDPVLLHMLEELDALAWAMKEFSEDPEGILAIRAGQERIEDQALKHIDEDEVDARTEQASIVSEPESVPKTPPLESLPFLQESSSTPISDMEDLKTPSDELDLIRDLVLTRLQDEQGSKFAADQDARDIFLRAFKPWRRGVDAIEAAIRNDPARENSTPPDTVFEPTSAPQTVRSRRIVSDYSMEAIMKESVETAAREDQARREREEREAQVYIPADTCNPEREADVPAMLCPSEAEDSKFMDSNDYVEPEGVLDAFRYLPPKDNFSKKEHTEYLYHYVTMPKCFGKIAEKIEGRDFKDCVRHYYASKRITNYRNQELKFYKSGRGKKFREASERAAGARPRGGLLASFDGPVEHSTQSSASLTESGRPRRAAAPTFGDATEAENIGAVNPSQGRRSTFSKESSVSLQPVERPVVRRIKTATGQKPGRKPKAQQLLAAAPAPSQTPSPMKDPSPNTKPLVAEPAHEAPPEEEQEAAQPLIDLPTNTQVFPAPAYTEHWVSGQPPFTSAFPAVSETSMNRRAEQTQQPSVLPQLQPKLQQASETTSYWSVPEKQDFLNYVNYFGTDWATIARTMKTKSTQMIKNYYQREIDHKKKGEKGIELQRAAQIADQRRHRNEDMGPMPLPTPAQPKRRYESNTSRETQRPLAPVDLAHTGDEASSGRPIKTRMSPPHSTSLNPRLSASSQAEQKAAASSAQVLAQGPQSPASRGVIHMQQSQQRPQSIQPPSMGMGAENIKPILHSRHLTEVQQRQEAEKRETVDYSNIHAQQQQAQERLQLQQLQQYQPREQQKEYQHYLEKEREKNQRQQDIHQAELQRQQQHELEARTQLLRQQDPHPARLPLTSQDSVNGHRLPRAHYDHAPQVQVDEISRRVLQQRQEELQRPPEILQGHSQSSHPSTTQLKARAGLSSSHSRNQFSKSPASSGPLPQTSSNVEPSRPSSVPVHPSAPPPQPAQPKKTSNIMSLLNLEPEEPKIPKRTSDPRAITATPEPSNTIQRLPTAGRPPSQFIRPQTPSQVTTQPRHNIALGQQLPQQQHLEQEMRGALGRDPGQSFLQSSLIERGIHNSQAPLPQPKTEGSFLPPRSSQPTFIQSRGRGMVSPPAPHSRNSSYSSLNQSSQQQILHEPRSSTSEASSTSRLRPSPWSTLTPPQHQNTTRIVPNHQQPHRLDPTHAQAQREIRPEEHDRRSLESNDPFRSQKSRPILMDRQSAQAREEVSRRELDREPSFLAHYRALHQQQQPEAAQMRELQWQELELRKRQELERELIRQGLHMSSLERPHHQDREAVQRRQEEFNRERERMLERERQERSWRAFG